MSQNSPTGTTAATGLYQVSDGFFDYSSESNASKIQVGSFKVEAKDNTVTEVTFTYDPAETSSNAGTALFNFDAGTYANPNTKDGEVPLGGYDFTIVI